MGSTLLSAAWNSIAMGTTRHAPFSHNDPPMGGFLRRLAADWHEPRALVARNFLPDEGVADWRFESYRDSGAVADHGTYGPWKKRHENYLGERVNRLGRGHPLPSDIRPDDPDACPETFARLDPNALCCRGNLAWSLIHVADLNRIVALAHRVRGRGLTDKVAELKSDLDHVVAAAGTRDATHDTVDDTLKQWALAVGMRPMFAGYWVEVAGLFGDTPARDDPDWPDQVCDHLGLWHFKPEPPRRSSVDVVVFRYPVERVPRLRGLDPRSRPLVRPTVLDHSHSPAFLPAPYNQETGYPVDLGPDVSQLRVEVVHPTVVFTAADVWRAGTVRRSLDQEGLAKARGWHIVKLRDKSKVDDYAEETDGDVLSML